MYAKYCPCDYGPDCSTVKPPSGTYVCTVRAKKTCPKSRVLLSSFTARIHHARTRTTVEDHGCTGKGRLFILCVQRAVQEPFDRRAWAYAMLHVNLYGPHYSTLHDRFFLARTVHPISHSEE